MSLRRTRIGVVGSSMTDLVTTISRMPGAGETLAARSFAIDRGGKGANQAVVAARLGADVMLVARVGDDVFGAETLRHLRETGLDASHVRSVPGVPSGIATILVEPSGENRILIVPGANDHLLPAGIEAAAGDLGRCALIVLQLEIPLETVYHVVAWASRAGIEVLLNPAPAVPALELSRIAAATFLVPNQGELALLTGLPTETRDEAEAAAQSLVDRGLRTIIVTLGADGALLVEAGGSRHVPAVPVTPCDTTGAGDAFIGAFAEHYVRSRDIPAAMDWAVRYAADSITRPGTQSAFADAAAFAAFRG